MSEKRSPYAKYGKKPWRYSERYRHWHDLVLAHGVTDTPEQLALDKQHRLAFGLPSREAVAKMVKGQRDRLER